MKHNKKTGNGRGKAPTVASGKSKAPTADTKVAKGAKPSRHSKQATAKQTNGGEPYKLGRVTYKSLAALIVAYLNKHEVFTGKVPPPNVSQFVRDCGVNVGHGMYGARLHEYCHTPRTGNEGLYIIDRRALKAGKDGRVFQTANTTEGASAQAQTKDCC
jgi:hypothetical protein